MNVNIDLQQHLNVEDCLTRTDGLFEGVLLLMSCMPPCLLDINSESTNMNKKEPKFLFRNKLLNEECSTY